MAEEVAGVTTLVAIVCGLRVFVVRDHVSILVAGACAVALHLRSRVACGLHDCGHRVLREEAFVLLLSEDISVAGLGLISQVFGIRALFREEGIASHIVELTSLLGTSRF